MKIYRNQIQAAKIYTDEVAAGKVDTDGDKVLTDNNYTDVEKQFLADQSGVNSGLNTSISQLAAMIKNDLFMTSNATPWLATAINSGDFSYNDTVPSSQLHPGVIGYYSHASNANSGFRMFATISTIVLGGGEKTTIIFRTATTTTGVIRRIGFLDNVDNNAPTDGAYFKQDGTVLSGNTANNTALSSTGTTYTLAPATWYRGVIELSGNGALVTFTLYADNSTTILWTDTISTNIPIGRNTGHGDVATLTSPSGTTFVGYIDYMDIIFPNARRLK